jgi:hypothetical protein
MASKKKLRNISEIRRFFHRNETPIYFVSATNFNLLGIDEWVRNFKYVSYIDCYDGRHPNVFCPPEMPHAEFESIEDINNYLLQHKAVIDMVERRGGKPKLVFLMFDERTEKLAREIGAQVWFPRAKLRNRVDNKIETVLQSAFGDSGHTTFFISSEADFRAHAGEIIGQGEIKIMKRIRCRGSAIEACTTKNGTIVGPLMTELVGFSELTPYRGGWCGNEIFPDAFTQKLRNKARDYTFRFGEQLRKEGYRGYFELDFLIDLKSNDLYLGELNPRITGASSMTNHAAFAHADAPLFLFHLLEFSNVPFELDIDELNARWAARENIDNWSQIVIKHTENTVDMLDAAPPSGIWRMRDDGQVEYDRFDYHRRAVESEREAFFLRILKEGDYRYEGADLGILVMRGRVMTSKFELTDRARRWIHAIRGMYRGRPLAAAVAGADDVDRRFKIL